MWKLLQQLDSILDVNQCCLTTSTPMNIPQQGNNIDFAVFPCMFARCFLLQSLVPSINNVRHHMIVELHEQELQSFTEPSIQEGAYYAVEYQKTYYFGRGLGNFRFLHSTLQVEQKCSTGQDMMILKQFTVHVCFTDLLLLWVLALLPFHNRAKSNKCTSG